jgi:PTS system nitrogen regulatory IIA component
MNMEIGDLVARDGIVLRGSVSSKRQALQAVAEAAAHVLGHADAAPLMDALMEREALGSTGVGSGVAIPHARHRDVDHVFAVLVRLETPIAFDSVDDRPVDLLVGLFAPPSDGAGHLRALAAASRALRSPDLLQRLRQADSRDTLQALLVRRIESTAA